MKALVGVFNQEKALVEAFSVIVKTAATFAALDVIDNNFGGQMHYYYNRTIC